MVKVLIIGAAGYIGLRVAQHLRLANHIVYGATRSASSESILLLNEVIPVVGPVEVDSKHTTLPWHEAVKSENIDVVIDLSGTPNGAKTILEPLIRLSKERQADHLPRIGYIYGSGMWMHGSGDNTISDLSPVGTKHSAHQPPALVAWRPALEREVVASYEHLLAAIVRPPCVYGGDGRIWDGYLGPIYESIQKNDAAPISLAVGAETGLSLIHVDDAAAAFTAAVGKLETFAGRKDSYPIFDVTTSHENMSYILTRAAKELGYKGPQIQFTGVPQGNSQNEHELFVQAINTQSLSSSTRAQTILGWKPTKTGFAVGMNVYARSWLAGYKQRTK